MVILNGGIMIREIEEVFDCHVYKPELDYEVDSKVITQLGSSEVYLVMYDNIWFYTTSDCTALTYGDFKLIEASSLAALRVKIDLLC